MPRVNIFHSNTPYSLILFRKKNDYEMILWNREEDTFNRGQWIKFIKIYPDRCSFDGKYFLYFYISLHSNASKSYSVLSKAPYFTAKAIWEEIGTWTSVRNSLFTEKPSTFKGEIPEDFDIGKHMLRLPLVECNEEELLEKFKDDQFSYIKPPEDY